MDERFYDLDDDFIDDDNLQEGDGWDGMMAGEAYMNDQEDYESSQAPSAMQYSAEANEAREAAREQRQYAQISERFRVLMPDQVEELLDK